MLKGLINLDHLKKWYLTVGGTSALAVFLAVGNHCFCAYLNNKDVSNYSQAWIIIIRNMWARVVQTFLIASSHTAFLATAWSGLQNQQLPVHITDSTLRLPAFMPFLNILFSSARKPLSNLLVTTFSLSALAFVTITVPAALVVQPMEPLPATLQVPAVDMSNDPRLYAIMTSSWEYVGPSNHLKRLVRNMLTSDTVLTWNAPPACQYGCSYDFMYDAPVPRCVDYTPNPQEIPSNTSYRANFNISESHLMLNMTFWPMVNGTRAVGDSGLSPLGTRCTFHQGRYTAAMNYLGSRRYALITNYTQTSDDSLLGTSLGFSNSSSCPRATSWAVSDPSGTNPCARIQMNTWAVVEAFSSSLSGAIVTYSQSGSLGPEERVMNSALMPNLDYLFSIHELYQSFDLAPWAKNIGLGKALGSLFANATLSLTSDAYAQNWTAEAHSAFIAPFTNKYSYVPKTLWWGYGCAFMTVLSTIVSGWRARGSLPNEESALGKILATTSGKSFEELRDRKEGIDDMLICYEQVKKGDDSRMEFTVKSEECGLRKRSSDTEEMGLLTRTRSTCT
ncbi:unnamed protein product [Rhizoctonia solani]|uniref:Uncharacterized protein n=1 Tax=Rhizoctonia solani TaxID=456999 RepID=A0A8H3CB81_9AGAM|nr:unnamed protein product [Rhizoctonia solani]